MSERPLGHAKNPPPPVEHEGPGPGPPDEPPPIGGRWSALYVLVIAALLFTIALCGAITWWGSR